MNKYADQKFVTKGKTIENDMRQKSQQEKEARMVCVIWYVWPSHVYAGSEGIDGDVGGFEEQLGQLADLEVLRDACALLWEVSRALDPRVPPCRVVPNHRAVTA